METVREGIGTLGFFSGRIVLVYLLAWLQTMVVAARAYGRAKLGGM